jgi:hypothetical protein
VDQLAAEVSTAAGRTAAGHKAEQIAVVYIGGTVPRPPPPPRRRRRRRRLLRSRRRRRRRHRRRFRLSLGYDAWSLGVLAASDCNFSPSQNLCFRHPLHIIEISA